MALRCSSRGFFNCFTVLWIGTVCSLAVTVIGCLILVGIITVIFCESVIWCVMAVQLVYSFYTNPYIRKRIKN